MTIPPDIERLALLGWRLAPTTRNKVGCFKGYIDAATHDLDQLEDWSRRYRGCNWTVIPEGSGVWALDIDAPSADHVADGVTALKALVEKHGPLPETPRGRSGGGGYLLVFRDDGAPIRRKSGTPAPGLDPRAARCGFTVAPSVHRRGGRYRWVTAPWDLAPPPAPPWLLRLLAPPPAPTLPHRNLRDLTSDKIDRAIWRALGRIAAAREGGRNDTLHRQAWIVGAYVAGGHLARGEAEARLEGAGLALGLPLVEVRATVKGAIDKAVRNPPAWAVA